MAQWECIVCGLIYDEAKGWPDDGIPAGTKWEDVPEDWLCPDCGVGKEDFELIEDSNPNAHSDAAHGADTRPIIVIGTGLAGYNLVREFRKLDADHPIVMITSDDGRSYSKPMLSTGYTRNKSAEQLAMNSAEGMAQQLKVEIQTHTQVKSIDTNNQTLTLHTAATIGYSKLVIAWGASTICPPLKGDAIDDVHSINDLMDYTKFRTAIDKTAAKKVVIIGSGLIGSEFSNDLINGGLQVETIDPLQHCLPTLLPETAGMAVQRALEAQGAVFHNGPLVSEVNHRDQGYAVSLNNGQQLDADIVLSAVGVRPRIELAQAANIQCNRGIIANRLLETSAPNVYTLGDCAEVEGHVLFYVAPLMAAAKALAKTLAGTPTAVSYPAMPITIKTPACPVVVSPPASGAQGTWQIDGEGSDIIAQFRDPQGKLLGFAITGSKTAEKLRLQKELPEILA